MIMDFVPLKNALRSLADELDHRVLIPANSKRITVSVGDEIIVKSEHKRYVFPVEDVVLMDTEESSAEEMARLFLLRLLDQVDFPGNISRLEVGIDEELGQSAWATHDFR
jgi:6-pyruvoyltetrahydropterin/6-carboxytetrahydropterin synthase